MIGRGVAAMLLAMAGLAWGGLTPSAPGDVRVTGDLGHRLLLNYIRLTGDYYRPEKLEKVSPDWPGDAVGREILALTLLARSTDEEPPALARLVDDLAGQLGDHGYLGAALPAGVQDEQYLSGHSWLLRGLCEYHEWKGDQRSRELAKRVVERLLLPARDAYAAYPVRAGDRPKHEGGVAGNIVRSAKGWRLSSDVGCAFIMLDGATRAQEVAPSKELQSLIEAMIERYSQIDLAGVEAQTHATLSALRGVMRFYATHPEPKYLNLARRTYDLYRQTATTEHYANYNWFGRPEWTEACAVVDSFMLATQLYAATGEAAYLDEAQRVYYNALCHAQRPDGGFGCDLCVGADASAVFLKAHRIFEAPFCCSMRGAEGLTAAARYSFLTGEREGVPEVVLPTFRDATATLRLGVAGTIKVVESTAYPLEGSVTLCVVDAQTAGPVRVRFFVPGWVPPGSVRVTVNDGATAAKTDGSFVVVERAWASGDQVCLRFEIPLRIEAASHEARVPGRVRYFHGPLLLGRDATRAPSTRPARDASDFVCVGRATYRAPDGTTLAPIWDLTYRSPAEAPVVARELLFVPPGAGR